ncbi:helix-turn-helix domain-containing protein [Wukongibacter sp. M2B1]|uniref:helix-turn-helix domain-containing protein n=1 Tax=Wukongibacter sp. M2B1 TaxID=3088895 RepID=UPI003D78EC3A
MEKHSEKFKQLGLNIAYYRKLRGLSQIVLAEKAHISRTHLSQIEAPNMKKSFSISTLFDIAEVLEVEAAKLFEFR